MFLQAVLLGRACMKVLGSIMLEEQNETRLNILLIIVPEHMLVGKELIRSPRQSSTNPFVTRGFLPEVS